jgi:hypothetical protein
MKLGAGMIVCEEGVSGIRGPIYIIGLSHWNTHLAGDVDVVYAPQSFLLSVSLSLFLLGMLTRWLCRQHPAPTLRTAPRRYLSHSCRRYAAAPDSSSGANAALDRTRNIGIIAHIDAVGSALIGNICNRH